MMSDEPVMKGDWVYDGLMIQKYDGKQLVWPYDFPIKVYATTNPNIKGLPGIHPDVAKACPK